MVDSPVMTPLSFRHFPSGDFSTSREKILSKNDRHNSYENSRVPSLVELMLHRGRTAPYCNIPKSYSSTQLTKSEQVNNHPSLGKMLRENGPFYFQDKEGGLRFRVMHLTSATLVVVPASLLSHWDREITKHCSTPLRVLMLTTEIQAPSVKSLASDYDVSRILL